MELIGYFIEMFCYPKNCGSVIIHVKTCPARIEMIVQYIVRTHIQANEKRFVTARL